MSPAERIAEVSRSKPARVAAALETAAGDGDLAARQAREIEELRNELEYRNRQLAGLTGRVASMGEELERLRARAAKR